MLSSINHHPRDDLITFEEEPHIYHISVDPDGIYTSVTTFIHQYFNHFDADDAIQKMMKSKKWSQNKYFGKSPEEIKALWEINRAEASSAGTKMHKCIEDFYNGEKTLSDLAEIPDMKHFIQFYEEHGINLTPYRSEWMI